jgi:hypothetical protein
LGFCQAFNGLSGLLGGFLLINDPAGEDLNMQIEWLQNTPFPDFLIPGIVLLIFIGISNVFGAWLTFSRKKERVRYGLIFGFILMIWIIVQVSWIGYKDFLQPLYLGTGLLQALLAFYLGKLIQQ